jgi:hypothetical protein
MNRATRYLIIASILLCLAAIFGAGAGEERTACVSTTMLTVRLHDDGQPAPEPTQPRIRPGRKSDRIERASVPVAGEMLSGFIPAESTPDIFHDAPPLAKFKKGAFHRYRPRDPTVS